MSKGRKQKYNKETVFVSFRVPIDKKEELRTEVKKILKAYEKSP